MAVPSSRNTLSSDTGMSNSLTSFKFLFGCHLFKETYSDYSLQWHCTSPTSHSCTSHPLPWSIFFWQHLSHSKTLHNIFILFVCLPQPQYTSSTRQGFCLYSPMSSKYLEQCLNKWKRMWRKAIIIKKTANELCSVILFLMFVEYNQLRLNSMYMAGKHVLVYLTEGPWQLFLQMNFSLFINFGPAKFNFNHIWQLLWLKLPSSSCKSR